MSILSSAGLTWLRSVYCSVITASGMSIEMVLAIPRGAFLSVWVKSSELSVTVSEAGLAVVLCRGSVCGGVIALMALSIGLPSALSYSTAVAIAFINGLF